tara:strand:+ start:240 stop:443 length:204 start_codon:yes stop_codon:yes gene_type:complete
MKIKNKNSHWNEKLHTQFNEWGKKNNLKLDSADLMLTMGIDNNGKKLTINQLKWLENFCQEWDKETN